MQRIILKPKLDDNEITMIIDGRYLCYRTKYSRGGNLTYNDHYTGVYYGFFNTLQSLANKFFVTNTVIMWDIGRAMYGVRREEFDGYKRRDQPITTEAEKEDKDKFEKTYINLLEFCIKSGFANYAMNRYEADDMIALYCNNYPQGQRIIVTRDEDMYQLIDTDTYVYDPDKKINKNLKWFRKTYGIEPKQWVDYKAISGCKSDTVPGIPGMGEKRTLAYLKGDLQWEKKVKNNEALYLMCHNLVVLPHPSLSNYELPYKQTRLKEEVFMDFCQEFGLRSFMEKLHNFYIFM